METFEHSSGAIGALIRALVRLCLKKGIRSAQIEEAIRRALVKEAEQEVRRANSELSVSKLSIMTGLHRSEVARLMASKDVGTQDHDLLTRIIGMWSTSKLYRDSDGGVRELSFEGLSSEFAMLVASISKEVTHYPILFELERLGAIEYHGDAVKLKVKSYVPSSSDDHGFEILSRDVIDIASTVEANVRDKFATHNLHLRTEFDNIPPSKLDEIRLYLMKKGAEFQDSMREYLSSFDRDVSPCKAAPTQSSEHADKARVSVTTFSYAEPTERVKIITPKKRGRKKISS